MSVQHTMTHEPKNPECGICRQGKRQRRQRRRTDSVTPEGPLPTKFGDQCSGDNIVRARSNDPDESEPFIHGRGNGLVMAGRATDYIGIFPKSSRNYWRMVEAFKDWQEPNARTINFYCDREPSLLKAARRCEWRVNTATTGCPSPMVS